MNDVVDTSTITGWKKEPKLQELKTLLQGALSEHSQQMGKIQDWNDALEVQGKYKPTKVKGRSSVQPRMVRKQAEWRYSALTEPFTSSQKLFKVEPVTFEDVEAARQNELLLNHQFRTKLNIVSFIDNFVRAIVDEGTGLARVGWVQETQEVDDLAPLWDYYPVNTQDPAEEQYVALFQQALELKNSNPRSYKDGIPAELKAAVDYLEETGIPTKAVLVGYEPIKTTKVLKNHPTVEVCDPDSVILDPSCGGDASKALFVVFALEVSQYELMNSNKNFFNLDQIKWDQSNDGDGLVSVNGKTGFSFNDSMKNKQTMYEYWGYHDINDDGHMVPIVASWIGNTLIRLEESPFPDGKLPIVTVPYLPKKRSLYGETDAELIKDNQMIEGALVRGMIDTMARSSNGQRGIQRGLLDPVNMRRFESGQTYEFNPNSHPTSGIYEHTFAPLPQSAITLLSINQQDGESLTGTKNFSSGISGDTFGRVATGVRGALDAASKREMAILRRIAKGLTEIAERFIAMNAVFLSEDEVVRVTNSEFVTINPEDLRGNFDLKTDISTAEVDEQKSNDLAFMLQTLGPNIESEVTFMIMAEIAELKRMPELANRLRNIDTSPSEQDMMMQQLEIERVQLEVEKLRSEVMWNQARAQREMAQAQELGLSTQDRATGVSHAREIERMKAQAEGNQSLEVTKALLKGYKRDELRPDIEAAIGFNELTKHMSSTAIDQLAMERASLAPQGQPLPEEQVEDPSMLQGE